MSALVIAIPALRRTLFTLARLSVRLSPRLGLSVAMFFGLGVMSAHGQALQEKPEKSFSENLIANRLFIASFASTSLFVAVPAKPKPLTSLRLGPPPWNYDASSEAFTEQYIASHHVTDYLVPEKKYHRALFSTLEVNYGKRLEVHLSDVPGVYFDLNSHKPVIFYNWNQHSTVGTRFSRRGGELFIKLTP